MNTTYGITIYSDLDCRFILTLHKGEGRETFIMEKDRKTCFSIKIMILTSDRHAEHPFAGQNPQHTWKQNSSRKVPKKFRKVRCFLQVPIKQNVKVKRSLWLKQTVISFTTFHTKHYGLLRADQKS